MAASVAVVGAGASGVLTVANLARRLPPSTRITLIGKANEFGQGIAYSTRNMNHLLNVPACNMSAYPDNPQHFIKWMNHLKPTKSHDFVPRAVFGEYLNTLIPPGTRTILGYATGIDFVAGKYHIHTTDDASESIQADFVVLAMGNLGHRPNQIFNNITDHPRFIKNVWSSKALQDIKAKDSILIVGTGLTMVDTLISLKNKSHDGPVTVVSRRGLVPRPHRTAENSTYTYPFDLSTGPQNLREWVRTVRTAVESELAAGRDWRPVIDALRPWNSAIWQRLSVMEKKRFLRHLRPYWDVHRHRIAPEIAAQLPRMQNVTTLAGRVAFKPSQSENTIEARVTPRTLETQAKAAEEVTDGLKRFDWVIDCTGVDCNFRTIDDPFVQELYKKGVVTPDELGLGIIGTHQSENRVFTVGPLLKGTLFETIAVPEIRVQARNISSQIAHIIAKQNNEKRAQFN